MPKHLIAKTGVALLLSASFTVTAPLASDYLHALFGGRQEAQWQFAYLLAPIPILLGALGFAIARFSRPPLSRVFSTTSWVVTLIPLILLGLVFCHAY